MQFVDEVLVDVAAGDGGNGCVAWRREKFLPLGGPAGGDGGSGGSVIFEADGRLYTLLDLKYRRRLEAEKGEHGRGRDQYGKGGDDMVVRVPVGTQVFDAETRALIVDLDEAGKRVVIARGGRGGRGNIHFATPYDRAPNRAEPGEPGERKRVRLELKLLADVGIVGFPNVGKSTFIATVSRARPKIADYPFTTLVPNLGVVSLGEERSFVVADIPGIIEGAAEGAGLGIRFLKHVERTRVLLHMLTVDPAPEREPVKDFAVLRSELERFSPELASRPMVVAMSKMDLPEVRAAFPKVQQALARQGFTLLPLGSATNEGVREVLIALERRVMGLPEPEPDDAPSERRPRRARRGTKALKGRRAPSPSRARSPRKGSKGRQ